MAYHHGNARAALLAAATAMLEDEGAAGLSLRGVAEAAGLSRQAPYNHFANKEAMLAELVGDGFAELLRRLEALAEAEPFDRLAAAAEAYIMFGTEQPALFRLMFARELVDINRHPDVQAKMGAALAGLRAIIGQMVAAELVGDATVTAWSMVHGYTMLCNEAVIEAPTAHRARAEMFAQAVVGLGRNYTR